MAYQHHVDPARRLAAVTFSGPFDGGELIDANEALYGDPAWRPGFDVLWDMRAVRGAHLDVHHIPALIALDRRMAPVSGEGYDFVLTANDLHHGLARLHALLSRGGPRTIVPCRTVEEVRAALARRRATQRRPEVPGGVAA